MLPKRHIRGWSYPGNLALFQKDIEEQLNEFQYMENGTVNMEKLNYN